MKKIIASFLFMHLRVAAVAAEGLYGAARVEALLDGAGARRIQNILKGGLQEISEGNLSVGIEATRHNGAVHENADLIAQTVAKTALAMIDGVHIGPIEGLAPFKIDLVSEPLAASGILPQKRKGVGKRAEYCGIFLIFGGR